MISLLNLSKVRNDVKLSQEFVKHFKSFPSDPVLK